MYQSIDVIWRMGVSMFLSLFLQILDEIEEQGIKTYELPDCESDEDEDYVEQTKQLKVLNTFIVQLHLVEYK